MTYHDASNDLEKIDALKEGDFNYRDWVWILIARCALHLAFGFFHSYLEFHRGRRL